MSIGNLIREHGTILIELKVRAFDEETGNATILPSEETLDTIAEWAQEVLIHHFAKYSEEDLVESRLIDIEY